MVPALIVLALLGLGVGIVAWATRRVHGWTLIRGREDAAESAPPTSAWSRREPLPEAPSVEAHDPFAHAPAPDTFIAETPASKQNRA